MSVEKNYTRLGLFIVIVLIVVLATTALFIQQLKSRKAFGLVTYKMEDVSGLDVTSPVRYRGVFVGKVTNVRVDPRGNIVEIDFELFVDRLNAIGANVKAIRGIIASGGMSPRFRARIVSNPVTGAAYLLLDSPPNPPPPIELGFTPDRTYVPSMPSMITSVQDRLPELLDRTEATLRTLRETVARIPDSLDRTDRFFTNAERVVQESQLPALSADSRRFFTTTSERMEQITSQLNGVIGTEGSLVKFSEEARAAIKAADLPGTTQSARDAATSSRLAADDLRRSLPTIRNSLEEMRDLARYLEEQPESVVYGPRPQDEKH
jgi:paraquat-inducible protein B